MFDTSLDILESNLLTALYFSRNFLPNHYNIIPTMFKRPLPQSRHITYKKREVPIYHEMEQKLMDELGLDFSGLHKFSVRHLHNSRQSSNLQMV